METSFWVQTNLLPRVQQLVKNYDGRFKGNPINVGTSSLTTLTFDDCSNSRMFCVMLQIVKQPYFK
jgi:hypothetical protein